MKLLIVDDSPPVRQFIRHLLAAVITDVQECEDGASALDRYRAFLPDFVLMDLEMKQMNGIQATSQILACYPEAKVIIVTNYDDSSLREVARAAGAFAYVVKEQMIELKRLVSGLPSETTLS